MTDDHLQRAAELAGAWLRSLPERPVGPAGDPAGLRGPLPEAGADRWPWSTRSPRRPRPAWWRARGRATSAS